MTISIFFLFSLNFIVPVTIGLAVGLGLTSRFRDSENNIDQEKVRLLKERIDNSRK